MVNVVTINLIQSYIAIITLGLLTIQILWNIQNKFYKYFAYLFVFTLPILAILSKYFLYRKIDPFYMYTDLCILCDGKAEYYINFLRISFYSISIALFAPLFKLSKLYTKFSSLGYYIGFYSLSIHIFTTSPFINIFLFRIFFEVCQVGVLISIIKKMREMFAPKPKV